MQIEIPKTIKVVKAKSNNNYCNCYLNQKNYICSFMNDTSLDNFTEFLCRYKQKYDMWPQITDEREILRLKKRTLNYDLIEIFDKYLFIEEFETGYVIADCMTSGIGLMGFTSFEYDLFPEKVEMRFTAADLVPSEDFRISKKNTINWLNKLI